MRTTRAPAPVTLGDMPRPVAVSRHIDRKRQPHGPTAGDHPDAVLAELAGRQHGVVARGQLLARGLGEDAITGRLRSGNLHGLHRGVYAVGHPRLSLRGMWMAAVLACDPGALDVIAHDGTRLRPCAVLSHRSAAALWKLRSPHSGPIDVTTPHKSRSPAGIRRHFALLPADEVTLEYGIPVTTVPRTIFDLAAESSQESVERMLGEAEYLHLYDRLSLRDLLERYPQRKGSRVVRACLERRGQRTESKAPPAPERIRSRLEERFLPFLERHRLPHPRFNAHLEAADFRYEVDCLWPRQREIVELDGWEGHGTRGAFRSDRARDRRLRMAGYGITRLTWDQLDDEPEEIARDLRGLLG